MTRNISFFGRLAFAANPSGRSRAEVRAEGRQAVTKPVDTGSAN